MRFLVWATEGMSGADVEMLVDAGKRFFVLHMRHRLQRNRLRNRAGTSCTHSGRS